MVVRDDSRAVLATPNPTAAVRSPIARWFEANPAAREFVVTWLEMRKSGESDWSAKAVHRHLVTDFELPFKSEGTFQKWVYRTFTDLYRDAIGA